MRAVCRRKGRLHFLLSSETLPLLAGNSVLGPVHMIPGQLIASGQLTDPGVNFASVHGLISVTVHMNFLLAAGQLRDPLYNTR